MASVHVAWVHVAWVHAVELWLAAAGPPANGATHRRPQPFCYILLLAWRVRQVADSNVALHLLGLKASKHDNVVAPSTTIGNKTTVASACIVGDSCVLGDKSSIKRSVLGHNVK